MLSLIVNPHAGGGRAADALEDVQAALTDLGLAHHVELTRGLEHAQELGRAAAERGELAVAFGGDGLIGAVADSIKHTPGVLGVLPGGRGNDFARVLGIPLEPVPACAVLHDGKVRSLDIGQVGEKTFIGIASCGFDSVANRIANETRIVHGNLVYAYGALRALAGWKRAHFTVTLDDGERREFTGYTVAVANSGAYGGGMMMAPDASLQDGLFDIVLVAHANKLRFLRLLPTVFKGEHVKLPNVEVIRAREVEISSERPFTMYADGDPIAELPVTVSALPAAVRVMVPQWAD
jgi:YegS/Rv2252/BmrU family lipid kinase